MTENHSDAERQREEERLNVRNWAADARRLGLSRVAMFFTVAESYVVDLAIDVRKSNTAPPKPSPFLYTLQ